MVHPINAWRGIALDGAFHHRSLFTFRSCPETGSCLRYAFGTSLLFPYVSFTCKHVSSICHFQPESKFECVLVVRSLESISLAFMV